LLVIIALSWILFQSPDLSSAWLLTLTLFGQGQDGLVGAMSLYYLGSYLVIILVAAIGCTELPKFALAKLCNLNSYIAAAFRYLEPVYILAILIVVTSFLADGSFNPFIYFRF
jgi:alginate O-acetyltransferase complex protein AlgI